MCLRFSWKGLDSTPFEQKRPYFSKHWKLLFGANPVTS